MSNSPATMTLFLLFEVTYRLLFFAYTEYTAD